MRKKSVRVRRGETMALELNLPPDMEQLYRDEAARRGMNVEDLLIQVIQEELAKSQSQPTLDA